MTLKHEYKVAVLSRLPEIARSTAEDLMKEDEQTDSEDFNFNFSSLSALSEDEGSDGSEMRKTRM